MKLLKNCLVDWHDGGANISQSGKKPKAVVLLILSLSLSLSLLRIAMIPRRRRCRLWYKIEKYFSYFMIATFLL